MNVPARQLQRTVLICLSAFALTGLVHPLIFPRQPDLPQIPVSLAVGDDWQLDSRQPVHGRRRLHPLRHHVAVGPTYRLVSSSGQWVLITPMASLRASDLNPESAVRGIRGLELSELTRSRPEAGAPELATGVSHAKARLHQTCLTKEGEAAHGHEELVELLSHKKPPFFTTPIRNLTRMLFPQKTQLSNCLLLTTDSAEIVRNSPISSSFLKRLSEEIIWPETVDS